MTPTPHPDERVGVGRSPLSSARGTLAPIVLLAALLLSACHDPDPLSLPAEDLDTPTVQAFCQDELDYMDSRLTDDVALRGFCITTVILEAFELNTDLIDYCSTAFPECLANTPTEDVQLGDGTCLLTGVDRTRCSATLDEIRSCQRALVEEETAFALHFTCPDIDSLLGDQNPPRPLSCQIVDDKCPQIFGGPVPNQSEQPPPTLTFAAYFESQLIENNAFHDWACGCFFTDLDFATSTDCLETHIVEDIAPPVACVEAVEAEQPSPPPSIPDLFSCLHDATRDLMACYDLINACTESSAEAFSRCEADSLLSLDLCFQRLDSPGQSWLDELQQDLDDADCLPTPP